MSCTAVWNNIPVATESLSKDIFNKAANMNLWLSLIASEEYPSNTGLTQTGFIQTPLEMTAGEEWSAIALAAGSDGGQCDQTYNQVDSGYKAYTYSPVQFNLAGEPICKDDLVFEHNPVGFLGGYIDRLAKRAQRTWTRRLEKEYARFARKFVAKGNLPYIDTVPSGANETAWVEAGSVGVTLEQATSELTQEMLDNVADLLTTEGAAEGNSNGWISYGPNGQTFPLLIGAQASQRIARNNNQYRDDLRFADMGSGSGAELLKRIGATRVLGNFRHVINQMPPRFTFAAGKYTRVEQYVADGSITSGVGQKLNPLWVAAPYEGAYTISPDVYKKKVIRPLNAVGSASWNPSNYMGEWQWVTGAYKWDTDCVDPLEKKGRHFAQFKMASEPLIANFGSLIIYKRCSGNLTEVTCT